MWTEGALSTPGPISESLPECGTTTEKMALRLSFDRACGLGLRSENGHLPPATRPGGARNARLHIEGLMQAHDGQRQCV